MTDVAILVPVLRRPQNVKPLLQSIEATTTVPHKTIFIADVDDEAEIEAIYKADAEWFGLLNANYAAKINAGVQATSAPYLFLGADDLEFQPRWFEAAVAQLRGPVEVVGINDMIDRKRHRHATHFLMTRDYAAQPTIDGGRGPCHEGYRHNFVDDELIETAKRRRAYAYAPNAKVRHLHPMAGAPDDPVYRQGRASFSPDRRIHKRRKRLWTSRSR